MKLITALSLLTLTGCASIPESTVNALANAGGGCFKSSGLGYSVELLVAGTDKGVIRNGGVTVAGGCGGIQIQDAATVRMQQPK